MQVSELSALPSHREQASRALALRGMGAVGMTDPYTPLIAGIAQSLEGIATQVPAIEAASGLKSAQGFEAQQQAGKLAQEQAALNAQTAQVSGTNWAHVVMIGLPVGVGALALAWWLS